MPFLAAIPAAIAGAAAAASEVAATVGSAIGGAVSAVADTVSSVVGSVTGTAAGAAEAGADAAGAAEGGEAVADSALSTAARQGLQTAAKQLTQHGNDVKDAINDIQSDQKDKNKSQGQEKVKTDAEKAVNGIEKMQQDDKTVTDKLNQEKTQINQKTAELQQQKDAADKAVVADKASVEHAQKTLDADKKNGASQQELSHQEKIVSQMQSLLKHDTSKKTSVDDSVKKGLADQKTALSKVTDSLKKIGSSDKSLEKEQKSIASKYHVSDVANAATSVSPPPENKPNTDAKAAPSDKPQKPAPPTPPPTYSADTYHEYQGADASPPAYDSAEVSDHPPLYGTPDGVSDQFSAYGDTYQQAPTSDMTLAGSDSMKTFAPPVAAQAPTFPRNNAPVKSWSGVTNPMTSPDIFVH